MSKFILVEGATDASLVDFELYLFNREQHRRSQSVAGWQTFSWVNDESGKLAARVHFREENGEALSPFRAPFGSLELTAGLATESLRQFIGQFEQHLRAKGIKKIVIKDAPYQYRPEMASLLTAALLDSGFILSKHEINSGIVVDDRPWELRISHAEMKRLKRCRNEQLIFTRLDIDKIDQVYSFLNACRQERGMTLTMTLAQVKETIVLCPGDFLLFGVFQADRMVSAALTVKVNDRILYDFYHGHEKASDQLSPVVLLIDGIYSFCRENKFALLDLGTSSLDGKINFSLLNFKNQLGCESSLKLTFEKNIR